MKQHIIDDITQAIHAIQHEGNWPEFEVPEITVEKPSDDANGDFATNVAMRLAKEVKKPPLEIAEQIRDHLNASQYDDVKVAAPGFINFYSSGAQFAEVVEEILDKGEDYGRSEVGNGTKVLLEYISANPTGPLTLPNGRGGYLGDVLSNVHEQLGYDVVREFYVNDRGNQIDILGESVMKRYLIDQGVKVEYGENLYQGEYLSELASKLNLDDVQFGNQEQMNKIKNEVKVKALEMMLEEIKRVVTHKMEIEYDNWFSEKSLYDNGLTEKMMVMLKEKDAAYEEEGAIWMKTSDYGDDKNRVLIKSGGEAAYFNSDVALYYERVFERNVNKVILVLGADHHGYEKRLKAIPQLLQADAPFDLIFTQMATLMKDGEEVRMSKRRGNFVTIEELIDEVGNDVTRFFFLMYSSDRHMNFDLELAKEKSDKNPVFYVQYAHARMCSIMREASKEGLPKEQKIMISHHAERTLVRELLRFPELLSDIAQNYEVHHLTTYAQELARAFHKFYSECRVIENDEVYASRYALVKATRIVLAKTLNVLGVSAPEQM